jgi:hypothetical protein
MKRFILKGLADPDSGCDTFKEVIKIHGRLDSGL